ncbi:MAG: helix-turn-helix domain-containing protein [Candidatus Omnitrophica bacterium]|nr:helix-turn-helix domain-containing protein [Candidatus Omnitrophota bacterium]
MTEKTKPHPDAAEEQHLSVREAAALLEISEEELRGLVARHQIPRHTVAGAFLRLRKKDIEGLKNRWRIQRELFPKIEPYFSHKSTVARPTVLEKWRDFWYFNDFYVICAVIVVVLFYFILSS